MAPKTTTKIRYWTDYRTLSVFFILYLTPAFLLCQFAGINSTIAATYYVDASKGDDNNIGDSSHPWKTINRAYTWYSGDGNKVQEGDTVLFKNGNYGQFKESTNDGAADLFYRKNWITYKAYPGHSPALTNIDIQNTDKWGGAGIGQSYLKFEGFNITGSNENISTVSIAITEYVQIKNCNIEQRPQPYSGSYAPYFWPNLYNVGITGGSSQKTRYITIDGCTIHNGFRGIYVNQNCSDINIINNIVYHFGEDGIDTVSNNTLIENNLVYDIHSCRVPVSFKGTISGSFALGDTVTLNSNPVAGGIVFKVASTVDIWLTTSSQSWFNGGTKNASSLKGTTITGLNGTLTDITYADGVHCDGMTIGGSGVHCTGTVVTGNKIIRNLAGDEGLDIGSQALKLDGPQHITVSNNLFVSIPGGGSPGTRVAFLMGGGTTDFNLINNTMYGTMTIYSIGDPTLEITNMYNNIIGYLAQATDGAAIPHIINHGNNIFGSILISGGPTYPFVVNSTEVTNYNINALFINAANNDFNLATGSLAINFGNHSYAPATDILGNSRGSSPDAGCYEYISSNCRPIAVASGIPFVRDLDMDGNEIVILDGNSSTAPCGSIASYTWTEYKNGSKVWEINSISPTLNVTLPVGNHSITLKVTDDDNQNATDSIEIIVMGLSGYYKFNEGSGALAYDSAGISTAGQLINGPTWTAQGEIAFDGNNDAVEITTANLDVNSGTIALWAYPEDFSKRRHFLFGETTQHWNNRIQLYCNAMGMLCMGLGNNPDDIQIRNLNSNEWYHIALVWNGMSYVVYVDGVQRVTGSYSGLSSLQMYADIGNNGNRSSRKEGFDGLIDEVRLYNRPLDANEIMGLALAFLPIDDKTVAEGESLDFIVRTKSGVLTEISDKNLPSTPSLVSNVFSWTPGYNDVGTYKATFTSPHISDGNYEDFETINISVLDTQQFDPIGHWPFDEMSGNFAFDISTSGNTGRLLNGLVWDSGVNNGAVAFSVPNDAVEIRTTGFNPNSGTIAMYVYVEGFTLSRHYLFGHAETTDAGPTNRIQLYLWFGNLCLGLGDSHGTAICIKRLQIHQWYHIAITWSWGTYNVYVDGLPADNGSYSGLTGFTGNAEIGNNGIDNDKAFKGKIDDVYIYNRALTTAEIVQLANN